MSLITLLIPIVLELLKLFFRRDASEAAKESAAKDFMEKIRQINAALNKANESGGDTSDLEDIINNPKR